VLSGSIPSYFFIRWRIAVTWPDLEQLKTPNTPADESQLLSSALDDELGTDQVIELQEDSSKQKQEGSN
jgi:hypothetical protein